MVSCSCVTGRTTPLDTCPKFRGSALASIIYCSSCRNAFAMKVCSACRGMLDGNWHIKLILLRRGDLLGFGGAASSSSLSPQSSAVKSHMIGASVSSLLSSCVIGMGLFLFVSIVLERHASSKHMHCCRSIACVSASAVACSRT